MTTKHTPGPWAVSPKNPTIIKPADQFGMASNLLIGSAAGHPNSGFYPTDEEAIANARLIAAAPELLEALEPFVKRSCSDETITLVLKTADVARARAAIANAKGEQQ